MNVASFRHKQAGCRALNAESILQATVRVRITSSAFKRSFSFSGHALFWLNVYLAAVVIPQLLRGGGKTGRLALRRAFLRQ